jgi:hypothetical protein
MPNYKLKFLQKEGILSPYFNLDEQEFYLDMIQNNISLASLVQKDYTTYMKNKRSKVEVNSTVCDGQKDRSSCCKEKYPLNDFQYYNCLYTNKIKFQGNLKIFEIIFFLLINILIIICCLLPLKDHYRLS